MEKNFDKELDSIKDLFQKKSEEEKPIDKSFENDFSIQFEHINHDFISPTVATVNNKFQGLGYCLEIVPSPDIYSDIRKAVQIVLTSNKNDIDFLKDPYILVEGFPKSGSVRIATSGSTDSGIIRPAKEVDKSLIETSIFDFLKSTV